MKPHLFLAASRPGKLNRTPPQDDPAWTFLLSERAALEYRKAPTREERLLRAHRIAAAVREANPKMQVRRIRGVEWTAS